MNYAKKIKSIEKLLTLDYQLIPHFSNYRKKPLSRNKREELEAERARLIKVQGKLVWMTKRWIPANEETKTPGFWKILNPAYCRAIHGNWKKAKENAA